jgi:hypothetical protein
VEIGGRWQLVDFRITEGATNDCPAQEGVSLHGTVRIRVAREEHYLWEVVIELEVPPDSSPEDRDHLIESVREIRDDRANADGAPASADHDAESVGAIAAGLLIAAGVAVLVGASVDSLSKCCRF